MWVYGFVLKVGRMVRRSIYDIICGVLLSTFFFFLGEIMD